MTRKQLTRALAIFAALIAAIVAFVWWFEDGCGE